MGFNIYYILILVCIMLFIIGGCGILYIFIRNYFANEKAKLDMKYTEILTATEIDKESPRILEEFIVDCFDEYKALNLPPDLSGFAEYVTDDLEEKIRSDLASLVSQRISPVMLDKLYLYYNRQSIGKIIADKIYMVVMTYAIQTRLPHQEKNNFGNLNDIITNDLPNTKV